MKKKKKSETVILIRSFYTTSEKEKTSCFELFRSLKKVKYKGLCETICALEGNHDESYIVTIGYRHNLLDEIRYCIRKGKRVREERFIAIMYDLLVALHVLHSKGIYLGYLAPTHCFLNKLGNGDVRLDFLYLVLLRQVFTIEGLQPHFAPELKSLKSRKTSEETKICDFLTEYCDLWSVGTIGLHYMLTNKSPFSFSNDNQNVYSDAVKFSKYCLNMLEKKKCEVRVSLSESEREKYADAYFRVQKFDHTLVKLLLRCVTFQVKDRPKLKTMLYSIHKTLIQRPLLSKRLVEFWNIGKVLQSTEKNDRKCLKRANREENELRSYFKRWKRYYKRKQILQFLELKKELLFDPLVFRISPIYGFFLSDQKTDETKSRRIITETNISISVLVKKQFKIPFSFFEHWTQKRFNDDKDIVVSGSYYNANGYFEKGKSSKTFCINLQSSDTNLSLQKKLVSYLRELVINEDYGRIVEHCQRIQRIPGALRPQIWSMILGVTESDMEMKSSFREINFMVKTRFDKQIGVDIIRCHQYNSFLRSEDGKDKLEKVLRAFVLLNPQYCYLQGLDSLASSLVVLNFKFFARAYYTLKKIIDLFLADFFLSDNFDKAISQTLDVLDKQLQLYDPEISAKLKSLHVEVHTFCISWLLTLFSHCLTIESVYILWDFIFVQASRTAEKEKLKRFPILISIAFLKLMKEEIMQKKSFTGVIIVLKDLNGYDINEVIEVTKELIEHTPQRTVKEIETIELI